MKPKVLLAAISAVLLLGAPIYSALCACIPLIKLAQSTLRRKIQGVLDAEQQYLLRHGRFAPTLGDLGHPGGSAVSLSVDATSDSSITIRGTPVTMPELTCILEVTPSTRELDALECSRSGRLYANTSCHVAFRHPDFGRQIHI